MPTINISEKLIKSYSDRTYKYTAMISHNGTVVAFAMDNQRRIFYAVLDLNDTKGNKSEFDVTYWPEDPSQLQFPNEIEQVGYSIVGATPMPVVKVGTRLEVADPTSLQPDEIDRFLSSTARLTADAPFQVFSDNQHIFVFRQAIANGHADAVYKLTNSKTSGDTTRTNLLKSNNNNVPVVDSTLLCDRFVLAGKVLQPNREVRYQRSRHKTRPASQTDGLGANDMEGNPFFEPTQELAFIRNLANGGFTVLHLPTQVNGIKRWQFFANNSVTQRIDAFNLEVAGDGLFNPQGTQLYTSPDFKYRNAVLEREPGTDPFTGASLIPISQATEHAETALAFDGSSNYVDVNLTPAWTPTAFTIEMWVKAAQQNLAVGTGILGSSNSATTSGSFEIASDGAGNWQFKHGADSLTIGAIARNWQHLVITYDGTTLKSFVDGTQVLSQARTITAQFTCFRLGSNRQGDKKFTGKIDEVRVWGYARTGYEIKSDRLRRLIGNESGLVGYWRFDEGSGNKAFDQTDRGNVGTINGTAQWVASDAPIGDHPGMRRSSFSFDSRKVVDSLSAKLYYQQEEVATGYDGASKPMKKSARVMVTAATSLTSGGDPAVAVVDFAVSGEGRLARTPDVINLPVLAQPQASNDVAAISTLEGEIRTLTDDITRLDQEIAAIQADIARIPTLEAEKVSANRSLLRWQTYFDASVAAQSDNILKVYKEAQDKYAQVCTELNTLLANQKTLDEKVSLKQQKQTTLISKQNQLSVLTAGAKQEIRLAMGFVHLDASGLTVNGSLMKFASSTKTPSILDTATGELALYYSADVSNQFTAAYFQTLVARTRLRFSSGAITLLSRAAGSNNITATISNGRLNNTCNLVITNSNPSITETWNDLPRDPQKFADILNGQTQRPATVRATVSPLSYSVKERSLQVVALSEGQVTYQNQTVSQTALNFDGQNDYIELPPEMTNLINQQITIEFWAKGGAGLPKDTSIFDATNAAGQRIFTIHFPWTSRVVIWDAGDAGNYDRLELSVQDADYKGVWVHWAFVKNATNGTMAIYRNGTLALSGTGKTKVIGDFTTINLGRFPGSNTYWNGAVDEFRIWSSARSQAEIQAQMNQRLSGTETGLVACYSFENGQARDRSNNAYHGKLYGDPTGVDKPDALPALTVTTILNGVANGVATVAPGRDSLWFANTPGRCYYFTSTSDLLSLPSTKLEQTAMNSDLTVEAWVNPSSTNTGTSRLLHHCSDNAAYTLALQAASTQTPKTYYLVAGVSQGKTGNHQGQRFLKSKETLTSEQWHHIAMRFRQSYGLSFNGQSYLDCGNNEMLDIGEDLTIEAFIQIQSLGSIQGIIGKGYLDQPEKSVPYQLKVATDGKLEFTFENADGGDQTYRSTQALAAGTFYRVAVTRKKGTTQNQQQEDQTIQVTDANGTPTNKTIKAIKSVTVQEWFDITFYINGVKQGVSNYTGKAPLGNDQPLEIGRCQASPRLRYNFQGIISEVRIWNTARNEKDISQKIQGAESGLVSWWQFEEKQGNVATDSKSSNHGKIKGATWVRDPDPQGSPFSLLLNGLPLATDVLTSGTPNWGDAQFSMAGYKLNAASQERFQGYLEEVRIWRTLRTDEQIADNLFTRLKGEKQDLLAYYTFDDDSSTTSATQLNDNGLRGNHLTLPSGTSKPSIFLSTAPISNDTAAVRYALSSVATSFHEQIDRTPAVVEYADLQRDNQGNVGGVLKRCYSYLQNGQWCLVTGYKVGNLVTEWIGQAQFAPQVIGYIEGAPPVPSENLTEGIVGDSSGFSQIEFVESETVTYTLSASKDRSMDLGFKGAGSLGAGSDDYLIVAPFGGGVAKKLDEVSFNVGVEGNFNTSNSWSQAESLGTSINRTRSMSVALTGSWEGSAAGQQLNPAIGRRVKPANMGFALVQSQTADIFALRLAHNNALVSFRMVPNPDIPIDWNIIPFQMNPQYTKQGTLDGRIGYNENGSVCLDPDYANARQYGEYSYYKPKEAYAIERRIQREEQRLLNYYQSSDTEIAGTGQVIGAAAGAAAGLLAGPVGLAVSAGVGSIIGGFSEALSKGTSLELPKKFAKRNLVNTYVWTADGGFFAETTQTTDVKSEVTAGSFSFSGAVGGSFGVDVEIFSVGFSLEFEASIGGGFSITKTKSKDAEKSFSLAVNLNVPSSLQKTALTNNQWKPVFDSTGKAVIAPGKVDAYRFKTFYLDSTERNFEDLFGKVVDPIWLAQSKNPNAAALRQANQSDKKPPCWRVFHRVTFISRILPEFPDNTAPTLESTLKAENIDSNWELIQKLDPFVRSETNDAAAFSDAVRDALRTYLPELMPHSQEIITYLALYYGMEV